MARGLGGDIETWLRAPFRKLATERALKLREKENQASLKRQAALEKEAAKREEAKRKQILDQGPPGGVLQKIGVYNKAPRSYTQEIIKIADLIETVHRVPKSIPQVAVFPVQQGIQNCLPLMGLIGLNYVLKGKARAIYTQAGDDTGIIITKRPEEFVKDKAAHLDFVHEFGHHLFYTMFFDWETEKIVSAMRVSPEYKRYQKQSDHYYKRVLENPSEEDKKLSESYDYILSDTEIFSRAYEQYITLRSAGTYLADVLDAKNRRHWQNEKVTNGYVLDDNFLEVAKAFDEIIQNRNIETFTDEAKQKTHHLHPLDRRHAQTAAHVRERIVQKGEQPCQAKTKRGTPCMSTAQDKELYCGTHLKSMGLVKKEARFSQEKRTQMCQAVTAKGLDCSNKAVADKSYCKIHQSQT